MPGFTIEKLPHEPIVIVHENDSYQPMEEMGLLIDAIIAEAQRFDRPGYGIVISKGHYKFDEILFGAQDMRVKGAKLRQMPQYRGTIIVVPEGLMKTAYANLSEEALGSLNYILFDTLDEALDFARANV